MKLHDGSITRVTLVQNVETTQKALFFDTQQLTTLRNVLVQLGGTRTRAPQRIMETPHQPVGHSMEILRLWNKFFACRAGHWGGWELETYPQVEAIEFTDAQRITAVARVTIGYSGATVELEKANGVWVARRLTSRWVT